MTNDLPDVDKLRTYLRYDTKTGYVGRQLCD